MGTHWSRQRLSLQNRLTLLRAGSLHVVECGLCDGKQKTRIKSLESFGPHGRLRPHAKHNQPTAKIPGAECGGSSHARVYCMHRNKY